MGIRNCLSGLVVTDSGSLNPAMTLSPTAGHSLPCEDKRRLIFAWFMSLSIVHAETKARQLIPW